MDISLISLLTAFGLGSVITVIIQSWLQARSKTLERSFKERKEVYVGLLEVYHEAAVNPSEKSAKKFAYWQMRCELVAPIEVRKAIQSIVDTNNDIAQRYVAHEKLKQKLRADLGISKI